MVESCGKMEKEKRTVIISLILATICIGILGYIIYFRVYKIKEEKIDNEVNNNEINNIVNDDKNESNEEIIQEPNEITLDEVMNLYNLISKYPDFRDEFVTYENLSESVKDQIVIDTLYQGDCMSNLSFSKDEFLENYKRVFKQEKTSTDASCLLNDENYECVLLCDDEFVKIINQYSNYELVDNKLIIYEKAAHLEHHDDGNIYLRETITSNDNITSYADYEEIEIEQILDKLPTFKHTFELNNENYYWLSSELVKQ